MNINGKHFRTIWEHPKNSDTIQIIDQRNLPHEFIIEDLNTVDDMYVAIRDMHLRGAGLLGAAAGYGMYLAAVHIFKHKLSFDFFKESATKLLSARPTSVNPEYAIKLQLQHLTLDLTPTELLNACLHTARQIADNDAVSCKQIGFHGLSLIETLSNAKNGEVVNILTHCNAGWLAFVDYGSATSPIYAAHDKGIKVHVWVDETRPRNQGARLTAWELEQHGVPFSVITDNAGGHLMQKGLVDLVLVGSDRTTFTGDVANKIGTYLKALAAQDNLVPFYVALPSTTIDWDLEDGLTHIPIEERGADEVKHIQGLDGSELKTVQLTTLTASAANYAFDVTPARLVTGLITERGICEANRNSIKALFPERQA